MNVPSRDDEKREDQRKEVVERKMSERGGPEAAEEIRNLVAPDRFPPLVSGDAHFSFWNGKCGLLRLTLIIEKRSQVWCASFR